MKQYTILFLIGKDKPGIVDRVSSFLLDRGANIEDSRMATMGGRFTMVLLFSCDEPALEKIATDAEEMRAFGFDVTLHEAEDPHSLPQKAELPLKLKVIAMDHPGIVQSLVHILHNHNVNIVSMDTQVVRSPLSGAPLFDLSLEAAVPESVSISWVKEELTEIAAEMNLDLSFPT
jgi:glycine cleavage system transcriptional repressor